jgi:galactose mutarotase-like enzyme
VGAGADNARDWVALGSGALAAEIDPRGAQLSTLRDRAGRDLLWDGNPAVWSGRAPLLFPIVGVLAGGAYRLGSRVFHLARHGFARDRVFSIQNATASSAVFRLRPDAVSLNVYPFDFELDVLFEVVGPTLTLTTSIRNHTDDAMPASFGYHPAFRWPLPFEQPRSSHGIVFEADEPAPVRRIDAAGLLTPERHPTPIAHRRLALTDALFEDDVLIFDRIKSRSVIYGGTQGTRVRVDFPDAPYLGVWSKPGAHFICIEPWHGVTDPVGFTGDFTAKPGVFMVPPGAPFSSTMAITLLDG